MDGSKLSSPPPEIFTLTSLLSLLAVVLILTSAYATSLRILPKSTTTKIRVLFVWHAFDALTHFTLEASYLWNVFFSFAPVSSYANISSSGFNYLPMTAPGVYFLSQPTRLYGAFYGTSPTAKLWQEYAKADHRWGGSDLTVVSLELLTVLVMAPLAVYVCYLLRKLEYGKAWFWMTVIATGELYGGFMTFAPEWLSGSPNLDTSNAMYLWLYLFFFNTLWVWFPLWIMWEAYAAIGNAFTLQTRPVRQSSEKKII